jgi:hypothetical protein
VINLVNNFFHSRLTGHPAIRGIPTKSTEAPGGLIEQASAQPGQTLDWAVQRRAFA